MNTSSHPNTDQLKVYLDSPLSGDNQAIGLHLAQCTACRSKADTLSTLQRHLVTVQSEAYRHHLESDPSFEQMLLDLSIERFLDGELTGADRQNAAAKISESGLALKAALHYTSHRSAMERHLGVVRPREMESKGLDAKPEKRDLWAVLKSWFDFRIPIGVAVPATAFATGVLIFVLVALYRPSAPAVSIAVYRDNALLYMQPSSTPGLGFFQAASKKAVPFKDVQVSLIGQDTIEISWPAVPQAKAYTMRLMAVVDSAKVTLMEKTSADTTLSFKGLEIIFGQRYEWMLSGETTQAESFLVEGGFVFKRNHE